MTGEISRKSSSVFLFLAVVFFMLLSPSVGTAQNNLPNVNG